MRDGIQPTKQDIVRPAGSVRTSEATLGDRAAARYTDAVDPDAEHRRPGQGSARVWDERALRRPHAQPDKARRVEAMFDAIARTYERVNAVASLGQDARWRARTVAAVDVRAGDVVVDVCCGTGDMVRALAACQPAPRVVIGLDFSAGMLASGRYPVNSRAAPIQLLRADAQRLPLRDQSADVLTCVFGVRNFADMQQGLNELYRVARPGARVLILEFTIPEHPVLAALYRLYCGRVLPAVGRWISRERVGAYRYLARSIDTFEPARIIARRLADAGFAEIKLTSLNFGGVMLYRVVR